MCPQSVKVLPYSQFVDTSFWVEGPVSTKCECDVLQTLCGHTFSRQGSCVHKVSYDALQIRCGHIFPRQGSCVHKVSMWCPTDTLWIHLPETRVLCPKCQCDGLQTPCGYIFRSQRSCIHKVSMWCPTDTLWTHLPESRVLCPQSVNVMPYRHFVETSSWVKGPVSTKCQCDALQTPCGHIFLSQESCVNKVWMWCPTDTLWTHLAEAMVLCPQSVNVMPYIHLCGHIFPRQGSCVHSVNAMSYTDILRAHLPAPRVTCPQIVNMIPYRHFVDISSREKGPVFTKCQMDGL